MDINVISWYHNDVLAIAFLHAYYCISIDSSNTFAFFPLLFVGLVGEKEQRRNSIKRTYICHESKRHETTWAFFQVVRNNVRERSVGRTTMYF